MPVRINISVNWSTALLYSIIWIFWHISIIANINLAINFRVYILRPSMLRTSILSTTSFYLYTHTRRKYHHPEYLKITLCFTPKGGFMIFVSLPNRRLVVLPTTSLSWIMKKHCVRTYGNLKSTSKTTLQIFKPCPVKNGPICLP